MPPGRHAFENQGRAIHSNNDGGGDPCDPMAPETNGIIFVTNLGKAVSVGRGDHTPCLGARCTGRRGEKVDAGRQILPICWHRTGAATATRDSRSDTDHNENDGDDDDPEPKVGHSTGTAAPRPIEFPLRTP